MVAAIADVLSKMISYLEMAVVLTLFKPFGVPGLEQVCRSAIIICLPVSGDQHDSQAPPNCRKSLHTFFFL